MVSAGLPYLCVGARTDTHTQTHTHTLIHTHTHTHTNTLTHARTHTRHAHGYRYDGELFVKPPEVLTRDRLLGMYEVSNPTRPGRSCCCILLLLQTASRTRGWCMEGLLAPRLSGWDTCVLGCCAPLHPLRPTAPTAPPCHCQVTHCQSRSRLHVQPPVAQHTHWLRTCL